MGSTRTGRWGRAARGALVLCTLTLAASAAPQDGTVARYVEAGPGGATARNLNDRNGVAVLEVPAGEVLQVHGQRGDWLQVEAPGGFRVWVYGKFLERTSSEDVLRVTGNHVNVRPLPSSDVTSFPLGQLAEGDYVRFVARQDPALAWEEDWIQVLSPPGVGAWVAARETAPLASGADGASLWLAAAASRAVSAPPPSTRPLGGATPAGSGSAAPGSVDARNASDLLRRADATFAEQREAATPDVEAVRSAYAAVLALGDQGAAAESARERMRTVDAWAEALTIEAELLAQREDVERQMVEREERLRQASEGPYDPFAGRFRARGYLERRKDPDGPVRYVVRFAGRDQAEIVCTSGRYDLRDFLDYEIGVQGAVLRESRPPATDGVAGVPGLVDLSGIEVLSGRARAAR